MRLNIKTKILLNGVLSVIISIMLVTIIVSLLLWDHSETQAQQQIRHAMNVIDLQLGEMEAGLAEMAVKIGNQQVYANKAGFIQENEDNHVLSDMLEGVRRELAAELYDVALASRAHLLVLYDAQGGQMCSVSLEAHEARLRYLSDQVMGEAIVPLGHPPRSEHWQRKTTVRPMRRKHALPLTSVSKTHRNVRDGRLWLTATSPLRVRRLNPETLRQEIVQNGLIQVSQHLDASFVQRIFELTDTHANIFLGTRLNVGMMPSHMSLDQTAVNIIFSREKSGSQFESSVNRATHEKDILFKELRIDEGTFFEGIAPLWGENQVIGAFSVLLSQEGTRKTQWEMIRMLFFVALICILIVTPLTWFLAIREIIERERMQKELIRHREHLEELVAERTQEIENANKELDQKNAKLNETLTEVEQANQEITESIRYASTIQKSLVSDMDKIKQYLPDSFFIWKPCEIVSGDIFHTDAFEDGFILSLIDCTGHGVPGAFMTMLAFSAVRRITRTENCHDPAEILRRLNHTIKKTLQQDTEHAFSDDGMDAAFCFVRRPAASDPSGGGQRTSDTGQLIFAGAKLGLTCIHNGEISVIKGDRQSLGYKKSDLDFKYTNHVIDIRKGMCFYMFTDGFKDQLGGEKGIRFGTRRFKTLLQENACLPFDEQQERLLQAFDTYKGENEMQDDVTVVGFECVDMKGGI